MLTQGEQLVLLALDAKPGVIRSSKILRYGLNAAALSELLHRELITLRQPDGSWGVTPVGEAEPIQEDPVLEAVWKTVERSTGKGGRPHPDACVSHWLDPTLHFYLQALKERGAICWDKPLNRQERYGRFHLLDAEAAAEAVAAVDRVRTETAPSPRDRDLAAIAAGLGLGAVIYPGIRGRKKRGALAAAVQKQRFAMILGRVLPKIPELKFTFDSSRDLAMAKDLMRAVAVDVHHSTGGHH